MPAPRRGCDDDWMDDAALTLQYPSDDFPALSTFRLDAPTGWSALVMAEALVAIRRDEPSTHGFRPNVLVNVHRLPRSDDPWDALDRLLDADAQLPLVRVVDDQRRDDEPVPARWRRVDYLGPDEYELAARRLLLVAPTSARVVDVISAIGTWPLDADADIAAEIEAVVASVRVAVADEAGA